MLNTFGSIRGCGRTTQNGDSAIFPSNDRTYSRVCGKIIAYQNGTTNAFAPFVSGGNVNIEGPYVDGLSLTYGPAGSRQHIWSFVAALHFNDDNFR